MSTLEILSVLVTAAALFGWISTRVLRLPITIGTMLLTVSVSLILGWAGEIAPTMHAWMEHLARQIDFGSLILHGMLPLLLFAGAFLLDLDQLAREKFPVAVLAIGGTLISFFAVAALMFAFTWGHTPWIECLIFGALISPTDPVAVLEMLRRVGMPGPIQAQLAGESLFNDGIGAVLFLTMLEIARGHAPTPWAVAGQLVLEAGGAMLLGIAAAWLVSLLMRLTSSYQIEILLTLALALGGYVLADLGHLSAPLEAVAAGLALRHFNRKQAKQLFEEHRVDEFWSMSEEVQNSLLFVLLGLEVMTVSINGATLWSGFGAILSVNAVRLGAVALCVYLVRLFHPGQMSGTVTVLTWGGLRGGLSIALALSVPQELGGAWIFATTYMVVVFSILLQGGSLDFALRRRQRKQAALAGPTPSNPE